MNMFRILNLLIAVLLLMSSALKAQELLDVYSGTQMDDELYAFTPESREMESRVRKILEVGGNLKINFYLVETNVQNVSAVIDGEKRFLFWSQDFFERASDMAKIGMTAHEMAHHLNKHSLTADRQI
jgi:Zn-dependent protease with chaperone function